MKYIFYLLIIPLLISCIGNNNKSDAYGNFETDEVMVSAETVGRLDDLRIDAGTILKAGDIAGEIDSTQNFLKYKQLIASKNSVDSRIASAEAQAKSVQMQINNLQKDKNRIEKLFCDSAVTQQQYDDVIGKYDVLKIQLQVATIQIQSIQSESEVIVNQVKQAKDLLQKCSLMNPIDGIVLEKYADKGEFLGVGIPIYKIANLNFLNLRAYISGAQLPLIKLNDSVDVMIDNGENGVRQLKGIITWISSQAEFTPKIIQTKEERVNLIYAFKVKVKNDGSLKIGMPGEIRFIKK